MFPHTNLFAYNSNARTDQLQTDAMLSGNSGPMLRQQANRGFGPINSTANSWDSYRLQKQVSIDTLDQRCAKRLAIGRRRDLFNHVAKSDASKVVVTGAFGLKYNALDMNIDIAWKTYLTERRDVLND